MYIRLQLFDNEIFLRSGFRRYRGEASVQRHGVPRRTGWWVAGRAGALGPRGRLPTPRRNLANNDGSVLPERGVVMPGAGCVRPLVQVRVPQQPANVGAGD